MIIAVRKELKYTHAFAKTA